MDHPEKDLPVVHVAGTNGKGSTCWITAAVLKQAGYRVGSFLSPHISSYRERILIDGEMISGQDLAQYLDRVLKAAQHMLEKGWEHPTEFEVLTAIAFLYFKEQGIDLAVLEVGMGGLYDSTNVIIPEVSVITSIDYDHMQYLGDTLEKIAVNKAGIIKAGVPVVVGRLPEVARDVIEKQAAHLGTVVFSSSDIKIQRLECGTGRVSISNPDEYEIAADFSLLGEFQLENLATALKVIHILGQRGFKSKPDDICRSLSKIEFPGRFQMISKRPLIIADVAHNPHGCRALAASLEELWPGRSKVLVVGMLDDKDAAPALSALGKNTRVCIVTRPEGERSHNWQRLGEIFSSLYPDVDLIEEEEPAVAVKTGLGILNTNEYMLISGSFYLLGKIFFNIKF